MRGLPRTESPFRRYRIITEHKLDAKVRRTYVTDLHKRGWIHPNTCTPTRRKDTKHYDEFTMIEVMCTPMHLGKICGYMLDREGMIIVEQIDY